MTTGHRTQPAGKAAGYKHVFPFLPREKDPTAPPKKEESFLK